VKPTERYEATAALALYITNISGWKLDWHCYLEWRSRTRQVVRLKTPEQGSLTS